MNQPSENKDKVTTDNLKPFLIMLVIILLIWLTSFFIIFNQFDNWTNRGSFGDTFGAINSLFSGLALAGIIYTILLQRKELALQRQELRENRKELARSATAQENSELILKRQAENLKATAKLNALSTLVNYCNDKESKFTNKSLEMVRDAQGDREIYLSQILEILNNKTK